MRPLRVPLAFRLDPELRALAGLAARHLSEFRELIEGEPVMRVPARL